MKKFKRDIVIYTDGGVRHNQDPERRYGCWAYVMWCPQVKRITYKAERMESVTNNQMEIAGALKALRSIKDRNCNVILYSDSKYVVDFCNDWRYKWKAKDWNVKKMNLNVLKMLSDLIDKFESIEIVWIKGHAGILGNEACDTLLNLRMDEAPLNNKFLSMIEEIESTF